MEIATRPLREDEAVPFRLLLQADPSPEFVREYASRGRCLAAFAGGELAGICVLLKTMPGTYEIANISVEEKFRKAGVGKRLIAFAAQEARAAGGAALEVGTGNSSTGQLAFYQKCGFRLAGILKGYFTLRYPEPIVENGIPCTDMVRLEMSLRR